MAKLDDFGLDEKINHTLYNKSIYFLTGNITEESITNCMKWVFSQSHTNHPYLKIVINSEGGDLYSTFALIDIMKTSETPIATYGFGSVMSAAFLLLTSGTPGYRHIGINTGIMCHQYFSSHDETKHHDLKASMDEGNRCIKRMESLLSKNLDMTSSQIRKKFLGASDTYMTAEEALQYNVVDYIFPRGKRLY